MTVKVRPYRKGGWEVDIMIRLDTGERYRERRKAPVELKSAAMRWGLARERHLLKHGPDAVTSTQGKAGARVAQVEIEKEKEVPTFAGFVPRFMEGHVHANRHSAQTVKTTQKVLRVHILPVFGDMRLDQLTPEHLQRFKGERRHLANCTVNKALCQLRTMLRVAARWGVIDAVPVRFDMLKEPKTVMEFYDFDEYDQLIAAATEHSSRLLVLVLLGGDAGLRSGEIRGLEWKSINFRQGLLTVEQSEYNGQLTLPKHEKVRTVPMTGRLAKALKEHRHLQGPRVLYRADGGPLTQHSLYRSLERLCKRDGLTFRSPHKLRHTFCSHLAMRGAPARAIQELAGHANLHTTQRYMHLSPAALERAIRLLENPSPQPGARSGDIVETV